MEQLVLDLPKSQTFSPQSYHVGEANRAAFDLIKIWPKWPKPHAAVIGPKGCGKTHLAHIFAQSTGAIIVNAATAPDVPFDHQNPIVVDDVQNLADEKWLFHLMTRNVHVMLLSSQPLGSLDTQTPDLQSRFMSAFVVALELPDDDLMFAVIKQAFRARHHRPDDHVVHYMVPRIERSYDAIHTFVQQTIVYAMENNKPVNRPLIRDRLMAMDTFDTEL